MTNIGAALVLSCGLAAPLLGMQQPKPDGPKVNAEALILQDFKTRVDRYMELHKRLEKRTPPLKKVDDTAKIQASQEALAAAIRRMRRDLPLSAKLAKGGHETFEEKAAPAVIGKALCQNLASWDTGHGRVA